LISHNRQFTETLCPERWVVEQGRLLRLGDVPFDEKIEVSIIYGVCFYVCMYMYILCDCVCIGQIGGRIVKSRQLAVVLYRCKGTFVNAAVLLVCNLQGGEDS